MVSLPTAEARQAAFARMQKRTLEQAYVLPFGSLTKVQAVRSNVKGFKPFRIPRMANVWFAEVICEAGSGAEHLSSANPARRDDTDARTRSSAPGRAARPASRGPGNAAR